MEFDKRKTAAMEAMKLPEPDNSPKGNLDIPIIPLLTAINSHSSFFTTSSCSGRISVFSHPATSSSAVVPKKKAKGGTWIFVSHDAVNPSSLLSILYPSQSNSQQVTSEPLAQSLVFRFEPLIVAVECKDVEAAHCLVSLAISSGFRESGITSVSKRVIIAIRCSIRMEVPLGDMGKIMVSPEYIEYLVEVANEKMEANRKRTDLFFNALLKNGFSLMGLHLNKEVTSDQLPTHKITSSGNCDVKRVARGDSAEEELESEIKGSCESSCVNLSIFEIYGEPIERVFLWGHSACSVNQSKILIFGGFGGTGRHARRNDLLLLDAHTGMVEIVPARVAPSARLGHTASIVGDCMYVIGGRAGPENILNDVWVFDYQKKEWKVLQCSGSFFPSRHRHATAVVGSKIYVFGGIHNDGILSSLYVLDTQTLEWREVETRGDKPGPLHSHCMVTKDYNLYLFGGYNGEKTSGNLYRFETETGMWIKQLTNGTAPYPRFSHLMFTYLNYLCILGGCPVSRCQEFSLLDLGSECWRTMKVKNKEESLVVRSRGSVTGDNLVIVGGGASCYAFGTKFSQPMKLDLLNMTSLYNNSSISRVDEKWEFTPSGRIERDVNGCFGQGAEFEELNGNSEESALANYWVLQLDKQYAKLVKDILKKFGWLDFERKVYSREDKLHICLPVTDKFCAVLDEMQEELICKVEVPTDIQSRDTSSRDMFLKDISSSTALNFLRAYGATKAVDEIVKVKKNPCSHFKVMKDNVLSLLNQHGLPLELIEQLPSRWERLGDMIILPVTSFKDPLWDSIGKELWPLVAQSLGNGRLARQGRVAQTGTRDSKLDVLVGDNGWVDHRENGILYSFDASKCMFSWGNLSEKLRMARLDCREQVVVDLFAGIGYFTLQFLVRAEAKLVYACEWNPHAIAALHQNLFSNSVADCCFVLEGDNRDTAPKGVAHRVCLGLLPSSECSWVTAVGALRSEGGVLHIHGNAKDTEETSWTNYVRQSISDIAESLGHFWDVTVVHVERVKWYAPHIRHLVVDVRCRLRQV